MLENFDKWWGVAAIVAGLLSTVFVTIVTATSDTDPETPQTGWQKGLLLASAIITRIFSWSEFSNEGAKKGATAKLPIFQTAMPDTKKRLKEEKKKAA